jgi:hypothetical protein
MMLHASLADVLLDPTCPAWEFIPAQQGKYWQKTAFMYSSHTGLQVEEPHCTYLTPGNALALYPDWPAPRFKSHLPRTYDLVWGYPARSHPRLVLRPGQAFVRRFWLGSLDETESLTATVCGERGGGSRQPFRVPADGGDWFFAVNGRRYPLSGQGGWRFAADEAEAGPVDHPGSPIFQAAWAQDFEIPLGDLKENAWNELAVGCPTTGVNAEEFLRFGGWSDWTLPVEPCWCPEVE